MLPQPGLWQWPWIAWAALLCSVTSVFAPLRPQAPLLQRLQLHRGARLNVPPNVLQQLHPLGPLSGRPTSLRSSAEDDKGLVALGGGADDPYAASYAEAGGAKLLLDVTSQLQSSGPSTIDVVIHLHQMSQSRIWAADNGNTDAMWAALMAFCHTVQPVLAKCSAAEVSSIIESLHILSMQQRIMRQAFQWRGLGVLQAAIARLQILTVRQQLTGTEAAGLLKDLPDLHYTGQPLLWSLADQVSQPATLEQVNLQTLSLMVWTMGKNNISHTPLLNSIVRYLGLSGAATALLPSDIPRIAWSFATLGRRDVSLFKRLAIQMMHAPTATVTAQTISILAWAYAKARIRLLDFLKWLAEMALLPDVLTHFTPYELSNTLWAFAVLDFYSPQLFLSWSTRVQQPEILIQLHSADIAMITWACATLQVDDHGLLLALGERIVQHAFDNAEPREVVMVMWAFAKVGFHEPSVLLTLANRCAMPDIIDQCNSYQLAVLVWGFAKLKVGPQALLQCFTQRILEPTFLPQSTPAVVIILMWGLATFRLYNAEFMALFETWLRDYASQPGCHLSLVARAIWSCTKLLPQNTSSSLLLDMTSLLAREGALQQLQHQEIAAVAWSLASWRLQVPDIFGKLADYAAHQRFILEASPRSLATIAWAYASIGFNHEALFAAIADRVPSGTIMKAINSEDIAMLAWAYATLRRKEHVMMYRLSRRASRSLASFSPSQVATVVWSLARQKILYSKLMVSVSQLAVTDDFLEQCVPRDLVRLAWSFAALGIRSRLMMAAIAERILCEEVMSQFTPNNIALTAWAYATLGLRYQSLMDRLANRTIELQTSGVWSTEELSMTVWAMEQAWLPE